MSSSWLPPRRAGRRAPDDLIARREQIAAAEPAPALEAKVEWSELGDRPTLWSRPLSPPVGTILYFHGGGYRLGSPETWRSFATRLTNATGCAVAVPDYSLAPEAPFPCALHEAEACAQELAAAGEPFVVAGDSAGGGLALALAVGRRGADVAGLILISPWVDLTITAESYATRAERDLLFPRPAALEAAELYLQGHPPEDPLASPLFADLDGLPPALIFAGTEESLLDDATTLAARLASAGVSTELQIAAGEQHTWLTLYPDLPSTARALEAIGRHARRCLQG